MDSPSQHSIISGVYDDYSIAADTAVLGSVSEYQIRPRNSASPRNNNDIERDDNIVSPSYHHHQQQQQQHSTKPPKSSSSRNKKTSLVVKTSPSVHDSATKAAGTIKSQSTQASSAIRSHNNSKKEVSQQQEQHHPPLHTFKHMKQKNEQALPARTLLQLQQQPQQYDQSSLASPTAFHKALLSNTTLKSLRVHLLSRPNACSLKDSKGRLPLHLLSLNRYLHDSITTSHNNKLDLMDFIMDVYHEYPIAAITSDKDGKIPFSYGIIDWVNQYCSCTTVDQEEKQEHQHQQDNEFSYPHPIGRNNANAIKDDSSVFSKVFHRNLGDDSCSVFSREYRHATNIINKISTESSSDNNVNIVHTYTESPTNYNDGNNSINNIADIDGSVVGATDDESDNGPFTAYHTNNNNNTHNNWIKSQQYLVTNEQDIDQCLRTIKRNNHNKNRKGIRMPSYVSWNFEILNTIYESILQNNEEGLENDESWTSTLFVSALASIPNLIFLLLFTSNVSTSLSSSKLPTSGHKIFHKIMTSPYGIGNWLVYLLERDETCCTKAIQYMKNFTLQDNEQCNNNTLFESISSLEFILPSILLLRKRSTFDEVIQTNAWKYIVNYALHNQLLKWIGIDFFFHITFLITFQMYSNLFITGKLLYASTSGYPQGTILECTCLCSILYLLLRKFNHIMSIIKISKIDAVFWRNTLSVWDALEWCTYCVSVAAIIGFDMYRVAPDPQIDDYLRKALVGQLALIYLNFIGWFKIVSYDMALLLRRLHNAFYDIRMYLVVFGIMIVSFSHMFHLIESKGCQQDDHSSSLLCTNPYLHTYATALGMFDVTDYTNSITTMILFLVFTSIVLILLFAILIGTVTQTVREDRLHPTSPLASSHKARFLYYAHTSTFDILLTSPWHLIQKCCALLYFSSAGLLLCMSFEVKRQAMISFYGDMIVLLGISALLFFMIISTIGFFCHVSFYDTRDKRKKSKSNVFKKCLYVISYPITYFLQSIILGNDNTENDETTTSHEMASTKFLLSSLEKNIIETIKQERIKEQQKNNKAKNNILNELGILDDRLDVLSMEIKTLSNIGFQRKHSRDVPTDEDNDYSSSEDGTTTNNHRNNDHDNTFYSSSTSPSPSRKYVNNNGTTIGVEV